MALEALIFDVDGTLANTERDGHLVAFNLAFKELGLDWEWSNKLYHELLNVTGGQLRIKYYVNKYLPNFEVPDLDAFALKLHQLKTKKYVNIVEKGEMPLRPGVERLFNEARAAGLRLAIATTTTYVLKQMNLDASECLAFEDSHNGILSTNDANIKTLITVNEYTDRHDFDGSIVVLSDLGEPENPFKLLKGSPTKASFVNVAYLQELYAQHC